MDIFLNSLLKGNKLVPNLKEVIACKGSWLASPAELKQSKNTQAECFFLSCLANIHSRWKYRWTGHP